jgi:hypothetical protein
MLWVKRLVRVASVTGAVTCVLAGAAWAAPPSNDTFSGAKVISSVPFSDTLDTTEATLDAADTSAFIACNAQQFTFGHSVWYAYTPSSDQSLRISTSGSTYTVAGAVLTGAPGSFSAVPGGCFLGSAAVTLTAGTTYYIGLSEFGAGSGGTLQLSISEQVPPNLAVTVNRSGSFSKAGTATVSGTASCSAGSFASVSVSLSQSVGRIATISGSGFSSDVVCDGTPEPWSVVITPFTGGKFRGGNAQASVFAEACNFGCEFQQITQTVQLKGKG